MASHVTLAAVKDTSRERVHGKVREKGKRVVGARTKRVFTKDRQKGGKYGKGDGKGPACGCWTCAGHHFASDCPRGQCHAVAN